MEYTGLAVHAWPGAKRARIPSPFVVADDMREEVGYKERMVAWGRKWAPWGMVTLLVFPATVYLWYPGLQTTYDGLYHKSRFWELDLLLRSGVVYPRWLPHVNFGYGSPTLHFYAPFIYYICEVFRLLGFGFLAAYELMIGLGIVAAGWSMFALARRWGMLAGLLAAIVYVYWPYHLELAYVRGAQAELWAMVWLPLLLLGVMEQGKKDAPRVSLGLALTYAALILTHHLSAFAFTPLLIAYVLWRYVFDRDVAFVGRVALSLLLGLCLAALYWLPVLADISLVWAGRPAAAERAALLKVLVPLRDVLSPYWIHRYYPEQGVKAPSPVPRVGLITWIGAVFILMLRARGKGRVLQREAIFFSLVPVAGGFMFTVYSRPLWAHLPLIHYLQFPWRLHALIGFGLAVLVALTTSFVRPQTDIPQRRLFIKNRTLPAVTLLGMAVFALAGLTNIHYDMAREPLSNRPLQEKDVDLRLIAAYDYLRGLFIREFRDIWLFEYMPVWSAAAREDFFLPPSQPPADARPLPATLVPEAQAPLDRTFRVRSPRPWTFSLHQFFFPAWEISLDGKSVSPRPEGELGLLAVDVPAGEHRLRVRYGRTESQRLAIWISLAASIAWMGEAIRRRSRWLVVPAVLAIYLATATAPAWLLGRGVIRPVSQNVLLGDRIRLVGSYVPRKKVRPGDRAWFALYWFVLAPPQKRYKVIVHLADPKGNTVANADTEPWFFFTPTTRWQQGEFMEDWYFVDVPKDVPPGRYVLLTGMYDPETMQNLPVQGGEMLGGRIVVGNIVVQ